MDMQTVKQYFYKVIIWIIKTYGKIRNYIFWGDYDKKHILFQKEGDRIKIVVKSHVDFVEDVQKKIDAIKNKRNGKTYISEVLELAREGCNYIVVKKGDHTVMFWTNRGYYDFFYGFDTPKKNRSAYYPIIGMLSDMGFLRNDYEPSAIPTFLGVPKYQTYKIDVDEKMTVINGYFGKQNDLATEFVVRMFKEIYMKERGSLEIKVG